MSGFSNITVQNYGFFKESRCFFEGLNEQNDTDPVTKKAGVRCHIWFLFLLYILGKIETITTTDGKKIYLNKKSYTKWRQRHADTLQSPSDSAKKPGSLPTAAEIVETRKNVIKCQASVRRFLAKKTLQKLKEEKELKLQQEQKQLNAATVCQQKRRGRSTRRKLQELVKLNKQVRELEAQKTDINGIKKNIDDCVTTKNAASEKVGELKQKLAVLKEKDQTLKAEVEALEKREQEIAEHINKASGFEYARRLASHVIEKGKIAYGLSKKDSEIEHNLEKWRVEEDLQKEPIKTFKDIIAGTNKEIDNFQAQLKEQAELSKKVEDTKGKINLIRDQILATAR